MKKLISYNFNALKIKVNQHYIKHSVHISQKKQCVSNRKTSHFMLFREIMAVLVGVIRNMPTSSVNSEISVVNLVAHIFTTGL
jgi:predicted DNA repair protein MutK